MRVRWLAFACVAGALLSPAHGATAVQRSEPLPKGLEGVGITEQLGARVPLDLQFTADDGKQVRLSQYFDGKKPVILTLNYYRCPMLCTLLLNGLADGIKGLPWLPGQKFQVITVSFDPTDTTSLAMLKKESILSELGRPGAAAGWHFLTGNEKNIKALTSAVGFNYRYIPQQQLYAHPSGIFLLSPDGRVMRVLYGVSFPTGTLKLALTEASDGKIGSTGEQILLYCFHYDSNTGRYVMAASNIMRAGGVATLLVLGVWLGTAWRRRAGHKGTTPPPGGAAGQ
jgi:protein SCO1/2